MRRFIASGEVPEVTHRILAPHGPIEVTADNEQATLDAAVDDDVIGLILRGSSGAPGDLIRRAAGLRVIGRTGVGYDSVDVEAAKPAQPARKGWRADDGRGEQRTTPAKRTPPAKRADRGEHDAPRVKKPRPSH